MEFDSGKYQVEIIDEKARSLESTDNDFQYQRQFLGDSEYQLTSQIGLKIFDKNHLISSAIIGGHSGATSIYEQSLIVENERILICCSDNVFCLSIPDLDLAWQTKADPITCFQLFKLQNDYVVHGELTIARIDKNGQIVWQQSGADIFTNLDEKPDFILTDSYIQVRDWENRLYKFDFEGNVIK